MISKELTRREAAETELRHNELALSQYASAMERTAQTLEEAQRIANVGSWEYDPSSRELSWSAETFRIFRRDPALQGPRRCGNSSPRSIRATFRSCFSTWTRSPERRKPMNVELRHRRPDGSYAYTVRHEPAR